MESCIRLEGGATGQVALREDSAAVRVEAQHGGILKLRFTNGGRTVPAQRTIIVHPWQQRSLEGLMFSLDSGETLQMKENGLLTNFSFEGDQLVLTFSEEALSVFARGGLMTLIDYYRV